VCICGAKIPRSGGPDKRTRFRKEISSRIAASNVEGVFASAVIRRVDHFFDFRYHFTNSCLNSLFQRHIYHATSMAAATEVQVYLIITDSYQADMATMRGNSRVQFAV